MYGRGGADDGYAIFAAITAIKAIIHQNQSYPRCVILIETREESDSQDLPGLKFYYYHNNIINISLY